MIQRFADFLTGITVCYKYIQRIKSAEMTELGLKGTHVACMFYLNHNPGGLTEEERENFYHSLARIADNLRSGLENEGGNI